MFEFLELFTKRSIWVFFLASLVAGISYYFDLGIINIKKLEQIKISDNPITQPQIAFVFFAISGVLFLFGAVVNTGRLKTGLLVRSGAKLSGLYEADSNYDRQQITASIRKYGIPRGWKADETIYPSSEEYEARLNERMEELDGIIKFKLYTLLKDLETNLQLMLLVEPHHSKGRVLFVKGFGRIIDIHAPTGQRCDWGVIVPISKLREGCNEIRVSSLWDLVRLHVGGVKVVIQMEQLVHPKERYLPFQFFLQFYVRRSLLSQNIYLSDGLYFMRTQEGKFIPTAYTRNIALKAG